MKTAELSCLARVPFSEQDAALLHGAAGAYVKTVQAKKKEEFAKVGDIRDAAEGIDGLLESLEREIDQPAGRVVGVIMGPYSTEQITDMRARLGKWLQHPNTDNAREVPSWPLDDLLHLVRDLWIDRGGEGKGIYRSVYAETGRAGPLLAIIKAVVPGDPLPDDSTIERRLNEIDRQHPRQRGAQRTLTRDFVPPGE